MDYKQGKTQHMTPQLWKAKKLVDSTLHPGMNEMRNSREPVISQNTEY